ncbi:MAG: YkgJ family cysteine cluster protein [Planctomycetota bacterium]
MQAGAKKTSETDQQPWYADGLRFSCAQCGNCCTGPPGYVWFTPEEGQAMAEKLGVDEVTFRRKYAKRVWGRWSLSENVQPNGDHDCVFLRRDKQGRGLCSLYEARPKQCRTWPFWPSNLGSKEDWDAAAESCAGMLNGNGGVGKLYPVEHIRILAGQSAGL